MKGPIGSVDPAIRDVHVWGGGVAGLLMAHVLGKRGHRITLHEKAHRLGGKIGTSQLPTGLAEHGPNALYADDAVMALITGLGLKPLPCRPKLKRLVWRDGALSPALTAGLGLKLLTRLGKAAPTPRPETTLAEYLTPLLGESGVRTLLSPGLQGIYGTGAENLTVGSVWPQLLEQSPRRFFQLPGALKGEAARSVSFEAGMQEFIDALAKSFPGEIRLNDEGPFEAHPNTVVCTDASAAATLLRAHWPTGAELLESIPYLPVTSVTMHFDAPFPATEGAFGVLFPRNEGFHSLGCLFNHAIFEGRVKGLARTSLTFILPMLEDFSSKAREDARHLGMMHTPVAEHFSLWPKALPLYGHQRYLAVEALRASPSRPAGLSLFGNYVSGISLREMVRGAFSVA